MDLKWSRSKVVTQSSQKPKDKLKSNCNCLIRRRDILRGASQRQIALQTTLRRWMTTTSYRGRMCSRNFLCSIQIIQCSGQSGTPAGIESYFGAKMWSTTRGPWKPPPCRRRRGGSRENDSQRSQELVSSLRVSWSVASRNGGGLLQLVSSPKRYLYVHSSPMSCIFQPE